MNINTLTLVYLMLYATTAISGILYLAMYFIQKNHPQMQLLRGINFGCAICFLLTTVVVFTAP